MAETYAVFLWLFLIFVLLRVVWKPAVIFEYPYFMAGVFTVFIVPQMVSLLRFHGYVSQSAVDAVMLMTLLCYTAAFIGYQLSPSSLVLRRLTRPVDRGRIFRVALVYLTVAFVFHTLFARLSVIGRDEISGGGMTGLVTIYLFFVGLVYPGFTISFMLLLERATLGRFLATAIGVYIPVMSAIYGRREPAVMLGLCVVLSLYFKRRIIPPRLVIFGALLFAMLAIPATGAYRSILGEIELDKQRGYTQSSDLMKNVSKIDLQKNFSDFVNQESILELRNAAAIIDSTQRFHEYQWGAGYWNSLVWRFVPAQIIGKENKESLMILRDTGSRYENTLMTGYTLSTGSTTTGMGDSFKQFGWLGCLFFSFLAIFFRSAWIAAMQPNGMFAQVLYILICTSAMRAVTHQTVDFLPGMLYQFFFLSLGMIYAGKKAESPVRQRPSAAQRLPNRFRDRRI